MATTPTLWKSLTQVNTSDGGLTQHEGQIVGLADGGYIVVWTDESRVHNPGGSAIVGQKYNALGEKVGGEVDISQFDDGNAQASAITVMPNGGIAVAFQDTLQGLGFTVIFVRRFDANLNFIGMDQVEAGTHPGIAAFADGSYVLSYTIGTGADTDIVARIVSATGAVGARFDIENDTDNRDYSELATLSNGNFVAVFHDEFNGSATDIDIHFRIMTAAGGQVMGPFPVTGGSGISAEAFPDVAALTGGGFVVVWTDTAGDASGNGVRATIYSNAGSLVTGNFLVNTNQTGDQSQASVTALADGGFLATWPDFNVNAMRSQRFDAAGIKIGAEFTVPASPAFRPEMAPLADGRIAFALTHNSAFDYDVVTSIWDPYGPRSGDFNHDVRSDLLWQNADGTIGQWFMNGGLAPATALLAAQPAAWHIEGTGDFNQDTTADILWRHDDGTVAIWFMSGAQTIVTVTYGNAPPDWHIQGAADFNGDGKTDLLWRHNDGTVGTWHMNGSQVFSTQAFANAPPQWHIQGTGDFNGDGYDDILWQHDNGAVGTWHMAGATQLSTQAFANQPLDWHIEGTGDFNGDGKDDILWRHDSGIVGIWLMNGAQIIAGPTFGGTGNDWHIEGTGDFNGDGKHDILWRHDNGTVATWHMNGSQIVSTANFGVQPPDWHIVGQQFDYI